MSYCIRLLFFAIVFSMLADDFQSVLKIDLSAWEQCDQSGKDDQPGQDCEEKESKEEKKESKNEKDDETSFDLKTLWVTGALLEKTKLHDAPLALTSRVHEFDTPPPQI